MRSTFAVLATATAAAAQAAGTLSLNANDASSIKTAASTIAKDLWSYYQGDKTPSQVGLLPSPYYWWEAGAMFGTMISYGYLTGDHSYDADIANAIFSQASPTNDFMMMSSQKFDLGNDDQAFWALTAMSAAEHKLAPPSGQPDSIWLTLASGAFNDLIGRWNTSYCAGGIKWQFIESNSGYDYKSSIANGATMQLGARLALLTGEQTYADKAAMVYDWMSAIGFVTDEFQVYDGAGDVPDNCTKVDDHEWTYNSAALIGGTAALANYSASKNSADTGLWTSRTQGLWNHASQVFFKNGALYEAACESVGTCNTDEYSFKAYMARWATFAGQVVPGIMSGVQGKWQSTAAALAKSCDGNGTCGTQWYNNAFNGNTGVGQQMSALEVVVGLLAPNVPFVAGASGASGSTATSSAASVAPSSTTAPAPASSSIFSSAAPVSSSSVVAVSSATPSVAAVPTTFATQTVAAAASTPSNGAQIVAAATSTAVAVAAVSSSNAAASAPAPSSSAGPSSASAFGSEFPEPVRIGSDGVPYCPLAI